MRVIGLWAILSHLIMTHITLINLKWANYGPLQLIWAISDFYMGYPNIYKNSCSHQDKSEWPL